MFQVGYREGASFGEDKQFQAGFDKGFHVGFQNSFDLAEKHGEERYSAAVALPLKLKLNIGP